MTRTDNRTRTYSKNTSKPDSIVKWARAVEDHNIIKVADAIRVIRSCRLRLLWRRFQDDAEGLRYAVVHLNMKVDHNREGDYFRTVIIIWSYCFSVPRLLGSLLSRFSAQGKKKMEKTPLVVVIKSATIQFGCAAVEIDELLLRRSKLLKNNAHVRRLVTTFTHVLFH